MKNVKKKLCMALSVAACLCVGVAVNANYAPKTAETVAVAAAEATTYNADEFKFVEGASIRKDAALNGIRFSVFVGNQSAQADASYWTDAEMGVMFIPAKALGESDKLEVDTASYGDYEVAVAKFDGNVERLKEDSRFPNGKLFNAVLNLTEEANAAYRTEALVARAYYTKNGVTTYFDQIKRAPAYVANEAIVKDGETDEVVKSYLEGVVITANDVNVKKGGDYKKATTNVYGLVPTYSALADGKVTASIAKGYKSVEFNVAELQDQRTFYNKYYTPADSFTYDLYGELNAVKFNGVALNDSDYTYENNVLSVKKSVALGDVKDADLTVETSCGNVDVNLKAYLAGLTSFGVDELGTEIFADEFIHASIAGHNVEEGKITINLTASRENEYSLITFHEDYLHALYANPLMSDPSLECQFYEVDYTQGLGYSGVDGDGNFKAHNTTLGEKGVIKAKHLEYNRATYEALAAEGALNEKFYVAIGEAGLNEGAYVEVYGLSVPMRDHKTNGAPDPTRYNNFFADAALMTQTGGLPIETSTYTPIQNMYYATTPNAAGDDVAIMTGVNSSIKTSTAFSITRHDGKTERNLLTTYPVPQDEQYVNLDIYAEETYKLPFTIDDNEEITYLALNGNELDATTVFDGTGITVSVADLQTHHNAVHVKVKHKHVVGGYAEMHVDTYYLTICTIRNTDLWSAMHFEDGTLSPFMTIVGSGKFEIVDSTDSSVVTALTKSYKTNRMNDIYDTELGEKSLAQKPTIANNEATTDSNYRRAGISVTENAKVLKYTATNGNVNNIYVPKFYYTARTAKLTEVNTATASGLSTHLRASRLVCCAVSGGNVSVNAYENDVILNSSSQSSQVIGSSARPMFDDAKYPFHDSTSTATYIRIELGGGAGKVIVLDDIFSAQSNVSGYATAASTYTPWADGDATLTLPVRKGPAYFTIIK